jgi:hypothetical protein
VISKPVCPCLRLLETHAVFLCEPLTCSFKKLHTK